MFTGQTFASYLPLFNVHAVFRASNESGIGRNDTPRDTAYRLYRAGNTLRAIYPGDRAAARGSCEAAPGCDYPVIIANDPYYGGLGGEFAISTSSEQSGTVVLRHELGHNFGRVGEEYDGGGYFGANQSSSLRNLGWPEWLSEATTPRSEPSAARLLDWPWKNLSTGPFVASLRSDGTYATTKIRFSVSGITQTSELQITLDGQPLAFESTGSADRTFYNLEIPALTNGTHELRFAEPAGSDGNNWLSSITVHEYRSDYHFSDDYVGAFPLFGAVGSVAAYRSNDELCLMRNMQSPSFCSVCQQNNWHEFLGRISLIDNLSTTETDSGVQVTLATVRLGQLRGNAVDGETLHVRWFKNGTEVPELADQFTWTRPARDAQGEWSVEVRLETLEVRRDPGNDLVDTAEVTVR
jgi:hypothetical protein